jgi:BlaI family penicillinase repressor
MKKWKLSAKELAVMELLWQDNPKTAREILEELYPDAAKSRHGTVQKLLQRLEAKGYVVRDCSEYIQHFRPLVSRNEYAGNQIEELAGKLTGGSLAPLITYFLEEHKISPEEIRELRKILEDRHDGEGDMR